MGLDISVSIVCGVRASDVFPQGYRKTDRQVQLTNAFGEPTGKTETLEEWYLDCHQGSFLVGDNKEALSRQYGGTKVDVSLNSLFDTDNDNETDWIHFSDPQSKDLSHFFFGIKIPGTGPLEFNCQIPLVVPKGIVTSVKQQLFDRFAYDGEPSTVAIIYYSY
jgi:hypothetical protein